MSTCCWCTHAGPDAIELLERYASKVLSPSEFAAANDDLCYCVECVDEYHKARDKSPSLQTVLWQLETTRLINHLEKTMRKRNEPHDLYIVEGDKETPCYDYTSSDLERDLSIPLFEILKYPYLLLNEHLSDLWVEALFEVEKINYNYEVTGKHPGIYLLVVHPNEQIRRWAIRTATNLGEVDRDDYYDIQEVFTCLFKVIELGLFENPDIYNSAELEEGRLNLLPPHLYDTSDSKSFWLGICMLLTVLEEQAMDSLLLGPEKQNDFMQCILTTMKDHKDDEKQDPFWPALQCFMVILNRLGSKVWGQLTEPIKAFQIIIDSPSYKKKIERIRQSCRRTKTEPFSDYGDEMITSSQMVYNYYTEKFPKDTGWKAAIWPDYFRNLHEDIQALASMLQSDADQEEHWHSSTFLWFIPFVHSLMDLSGGNLYIVTVVCHLCLEINKVFCEATHSCDKASESFILILVAVVQLHLAKGCLHLLRVSSHFWVEVVVKCAKLPSAAPAHSSEGALRNFPRTSGPVSSQGPCSMQLVCMRLIRSLLKEAYQQGLQGSCKIFLDRLNFLLRNHDVSQGWQLSAEDTRELQACLLEFIKSIDDKQLTTASHGESAAACISPPVFSVKQERETGGDRCPVNPPCQQAACPPLRSDEVCQEGPSPRRVSGLGEEHREVSRRDQNLHKAPERPVPNIKQEPEERSVLEGNHLACPKLANGHKNAQDKEHCPQDPENERERESSYKSYFEQDLLNPENNNRDGKEARSRPSECLPVPEKDPDGRNGSSGSAVKMSVDSLAKIKIVLEKSSLTSKLKQFIKNNRRGTTTPEPAAEKQLCLKDGSRGQEEGTSEIRGTGYSLLNVCKQEPSSVDASEDKPLCPQKKSVDRLAESRGAPRAECDLEESSSDDENIPYSVIRKDLKKSRLAATATLLTDSQIDRDLGRLSLAAYAKGVNFPVDSSQESTVHEQNCIQRKVGGAVRSCCGGESSQSSPDADEPGNQIIVISDSSSDEDKNKVHMATEREREKGGASLQKPSDCVFESARGHELPTASSSPLPAEECESQCFEFETEDEIYSAWQDSQGDEEAAVDPSEQQGPPIKPRSSHAQWDLETGRQTNDRGYDTDYIGEEVIEKAAEAFEQQVNSKRKDSKAETPNNEAVVGKGNAKDFTETHANGGGSARRDSPLLLSPSTSAGPSASKSANEKSKTRPVKSPAKSQLLKMGHKRAEKGNLKPSALNKKSPQTKSFRSAPAVVPPKKVHGYPQPASTVEKLGLKKAPRKAAELSQRSLDCLAELRSYGKAAGELGSPQQRKSKLIPAQSLMDKNRKMLACQDLQFYRQSKPKLKERGRHIHGRNPETKPLKIAKKVVPKQSVPQVARGAANEFQKERAVCSSSPSNSERKKLCQRPLEREEVQPTSVSPVNKEFSLAGQSTNFDMNVEDNTAVVTPFLGNLGSTVTAGTKTNFVVSSYFSSSPCDKAVSEETSSKLSMDNEEDNDLFLTQRAPVDMEICSQVENGMIVVENVPEGPLQGHSLNTDLCKHVGCAEKVNKAGAYCTKHSALAPLDHVFAKPLPPKPSTAKIFCATSSRSANLTKDLENFHKTSLALKSKPALKMDGIKRLSFTNVLGPRNSNDPQFQNTRSNRVAEIAKAQPTPGIRAGQEMHLHFPQVNHFSTQKRDYSIFNKEVLRWNYDMFARFNQFGVPESLLQSIVGPVPARFKGYNDYFDTFFPLMVLNAFETVTQEWLENQKSREQKEFLLKLLSLSADSNGADFTAEIQETDLESQMHPKESDLVFLMVSKRQNPYSEESGMELVRHVGLVTNFSQPSVREAKRKEQKVVCRLSIQTQGSLSFISKEARCTVVSSLVTTQRRFKALLLLSRSPLASPIYSASYANFCPKGLNMDSVNAVPDMAEYNEDQKKAIETAYTMVMKFPMFPQICLIHGPPGTGKSKTIVGLLYRILAERPGKENAAHSLNAKIKRNRVLVCAPSNAAVDGLMKKIILFFKEKCQDKENPLGNCGDINLVRLGQEKSISEGVRKFSLNDQIEHRKNRGKLGHDQDLHKRKEELDQQLDRLSRQRAMERETQEKRQKLDEEICRLSKERERLAHQLKEVRGRSQELKTNIILESHIICCTLSTSGGALLESAFRRQTYNPISCIIVDEAGQACEVETLVPLIHGCRKLVLVGDPKQLPPTVISVKAQDYGYDQSLMGRLCRHLEEQAQMNAIRELPVLQLTMQYRMHPDICLFPSNYIYGRALKTDRQTEETRCSSKWPFQSYLLFDVRDGQEQRESDSFANPQEVKLVMELMKLIKQKHVQIGFHHIGIITPYNAQKKRILKELDKTFGENRATIVDTVDGFQGREKDCIIVTCVRANSTQGSIGFLKSLQRLNVTITRAKYSLFILGQLKTLMENRDWNELIQDAQRRGTIVKTSHDSYKKDAAKILKLRPVAQRTRSLPGAAVPGRTLQGPAGPVGSEQKEGSSRKDGSARQLPASASTSAEVSHRPSHVTSKQPALPHQTMSAQERPQDPRLARRAPAERACTENGNSAPSGSGVALPQGLDAAPGQRNGSNSIRAIASKTERSGKPGAAREATGLGTEWRKGRQDSGSRSRKASGEGLATESPAAAKRRRTTY